MANWTADDGTVLNFELHGKRSNNDVILLLPGLLGSINNHWRKFVEPLSADFRVVIMDLRGHGHSTNQAATLTPERMLQDIMGLLAHLEFTRVNIAGYDLGGYLGLMLALNDPVLVSSLLIHGTKFYWTPEAAAAMRTQLEPGNLAARVPAYADQLVQEHGGRQWRVLARQAADLVGLLAQNGLTEGVAAQTKCPTIISVGDRDEMVPLPEAQRLSRVIPDGRLFVLPDVHHSFQSIRLIPLLPMMQFFHKTAKR